MGNGHIIVLKVRMFHIKYVYYNLYCGFFEFVSVYILFLFCLN